MSKIQPVCKICPVCKREYPDEVKFCLDCKDKVKLVDALAPSTETAPNLAALLAAEKKKLVRKMLMFLIPLVVVLIAGTGVFVFFQTRGTPAKANVAQSSQNNLPVANYTDPKALIAALKATASKQHMKNFDFSTLTNIETFPYASKTMADTIPGFSYDLKTKSKNIDLFYSYESQTKKQGFDLDIKRKADSPDLTNDELAIIKVFLHTVLKPGYSTYSTLDGFLNLNDMTEYDMHFGPTTIIKDKYYGKFLHNNPLTFIMITDSHVENNIRLEFKVSTK